MKKEYFISGIDTDCGKTYVTGLLAKELLKNEKEIITTKLVQTGCDTISEDIEEHRRIMGVNLLPEDKSKQTCPFVYSYPASPHLAIDIDQQSIDLEIVRNNNQSLLQSYDILLSEGAGGLMVPITEDYLCLDYIKDNDLELILVCSSKLGSINHSLLSLEICKQNNVKLKAVIYNELPEADKRISKETYRFLNYYLNKNYYNTELVHIKDIAKLAEIL